MKSILDPSFRYTPSFNTDLQKTFARIRRETLRDAEKPVAGTAGTLVNISSIARKEKCVTDCLCCGCSSARPTSATAQVSVGIGLPGVSIGINLPVYPQLVAVPGYPVYYAPQVIRTISSTTACTGCIRATTGTRVPGTTGHGGFAPDVVPLYVLRVPVRYYRQPPVYFRGWRADAPPRWGDHWGNAWEHSHSGLDHWNRSAALAPAPLPVYQRQYSGTRYPQVEQQQVLQTQNYRYQPHDAVVQQHYQAQRVEGPHVRSAGTAGHAAAEDCSAAAVPAGRQPADRTPPKSPPPPHRQPPQQGGANVQRPAVAQTVPPQGGASAQHQTQPPAQGASGTADIKGAGPGQGIEGKGAAHESKQGQQNGPDSGEPQGGNRNK